MADAKTKFDQAAKRLREAKAELAEANASRDGAQKRCIAASDEAQRAEVAFYDAAHELGNLTPPPSQLVDLAAVHWQDEFRSRAGR